MQAVTKEEYTDAVNILNSEAGGVFKGSGNKMKKDPNRMALGSEDIYAWRAYGVVENESSYINLFSAASGLIMKRELKTPISKEEIRSLQVGEMVYLSGKIYCGQMPFFRICRLIDEVILVRLT